MEKLNVQTATKMSIKKLNFSLLEALDLAFATSADYD